jgi:tetratricopeptide (TPR) repeat protein
MKRLSLLLFALTAVAGVAAQERNGVDPPYTLPMPRRVHDDDFPSFSESDLEQLRLKLKVERERLNSDWQTLKKRNTVPSIPVDVERSKLEAQLRGLLKRLQEKAKPDADHSPPIEPKKSESATKETETKPIEKTPAQSAVLSPAVEVVDPLAQAHALMRNRQYDEALNAFEQIDLKVRKSGDRAPIQYLKACCLLNLGKTKEAGDLLQEVANTRADEKLAGYAQMQLEAQRWRRDLDQRLEEVRQRQKAVEKRQ